MLKLNRTVQTEDVDAYLSAIQASGVFGQSERRLRLLEHLLQSEVAGDGDRLKAYALGVDVFGKPDSFDPSTDSSVRVEMGRLRSAIDRFEADEPNLRIQVEIPVGTYQPIISLREVAPEPSEAPLSGASPRIWILGGTAAVAFVVIGAVTMTSFMTGVPDRRIPPETIGVQIRSFQGPSDMANDVESGLRQSLTRSQALRVLDPPNQFGIHPNATFVVSGHVRGTERGQVITARLTSTDTDGVLWTASMVADGTSPLVDLVGQRLGSDLRVRVYGSARTLLEQFDPNDLSAEALFVLGTWVPGPSFATQAWEEERLALIRRALELDSAFGPAHSVMADKIAYLANVYANSDSHEIQALAEWHAQQAMQLSPSNADVVFNVAQSQWHSGQVAQSIRTMTRAIELDPRHDVARFLRTVIPYTCSVAPDDVLNTAIAFDERLSADNPIRWLTLTWIGWLHAYREEWEEALQFEEAAALIFEIPYSTMRRAMILAQLDRIEDASDVITAQGESWPGFEPEHFAETTIPRLCRETSDSDTIMGYYIDLIDGLEVLQ